MTISFVLKFSFMFHAPLYPLASPMVGTQHPKIFILLLSSCVKKVKKTNENIMKPLSKRNFWKCSLAWYCRAMGVKLHFYVF